jgi:hypothetical protein
VLHSTKETQLRQLVKLGKEDANMKIIKAAFIVPVRAVAGVMPQTSSGSRRSTATSARRSSGWKGRTSAAMKCAEAAEQRIVDWGKSCPAGAQIDRAARRRNEKPPEGGFFCTATTRFPVEIW